MPLKLNVGLSRKVGQPDYGSRGASVNIELELDAAAVAQPERLHDQIRELYDLARISIDEELGGPSGHPAHADAPQHAGNGRGNGHSGDGGERRQYGSQNGGNGRQATQSQCRVIRTIAGRQRLDLTGLLRERFGVGQVEDLSLGEASSLIDELKAGSRQ